MKLIAWRMPPVWRELKGNVFDVSKGPSVLKGQEKLLASTRQVLILIANDIRDGLMETVGVESALSIDDRCSMMLILPDGVDTERIASAIDAENVESWCDESNRVHIAVDPWYSTKDVDQTVLSATKVIHVLLGLHANDADRSMSLGQKFKVSLAEILSLQKKG